MHCGHVIGYEGGEGQASPPRGQNRAAPPPPKIFGEGATDNAPAGRGEGGGEAGLARVTYFDAITLCPAHNPVGAAAGLRYALRGVHYRFIPCVKSRQPEWAGVIARLL